MTGGRLFKKAGVSTAALSQTNSQLNAVTVAGTRPEIIKLAEFVKCMKRKTSRHSLVYTGQHFSSNMRDVFFDELGVTPDHDLNCTTSDVGQLQSKLASFFREARPEYVIVYGDTYSTMAATLAAVELGIKLIHLEAGIRDLDTSIPEERVRMYVDSVSEFLMAPTELAKTFLMYEGITRNVSVTGNLIVDVCRKASKIALDHKIAGVPEKYLLLTMHRQENVDDPHNLSLLCEKLSSLDRVVVFPVHPRTRVNLERHNIQFSDNVKLIDAVGYLEFINLLQNCDLVMTDSGGVTEEATILRKPCITLRHSTARWETILLKANILFPLDRNASLTEAVDNMMQAKIFANPYGEDVAEKTSEMVTQIIEGQRYVRTDASPY